MKLTLLARSVSHFTFLVNMEAVVQRCSVKKVFLEISQNSQGNSCASEFCEISKNNFSYRTPPVAASIVNNK